MGIQLLVADHVVRSADDPLHVLVQAEDPLVPIATLVPLMHADTGGARSV
jgi:hypothetical protein